MTRQLFQYDSVIGYRFIAGLKARVPRPGGGYLVRANSLGFRCDHEVTPAPAPQTRRVLLFGDSFTAGDLVSNGERYGDLLESRIARLEVLNFGLPGTGTDQQYLAYREHARDVEHDLLILAVQVENIRRVAARARAFHDEDGHEVIYAKPYYELEDGELVLRNVPVPKKPKRAEDLDEDERQQVDHGGRLRNLRALVNRLGLREVAQKITRYQPLPEYDRVDHSAWRVMRAILERWILEHPRPALLVPIPLYHYVEEHSEASAYRARFGELAAATGCALHDPLEDLRSYSMDDRLAFRFGQNPHPTPAGHSALADSLAPVVEALLEAPRPGQPPGEVSR